MGNAAFQSANDSTVTAVYSPLEALQPSWQRWLLVENKHRPMARLCCQTDSLHCTLRRVIYHLYVSALKLLPAFLRLIVINTEHSKQVPVRREYISLST